MHRRRESYDQCGRFTKASVSLAHPPPIENRGLVLFSCFPARTPKHQRLPLLWPQGLDFGKGIGRARDYSCSAEQAAVVRRGVVQNRSARFTAYGIVFSIVFIPLCNIFTAFRVVVARWLSTSLGSGDRWCRQAPN